MEYKSLEEQKAFVKKQFAKKGELIYKSLLDTCILLESTEVLPRDIEKEWYQIFFNEFYQFRMNLKSKPRMTEGQGKALKGIIKHLIRISQGKDYQSAFKGWQMILQNWGKLTPYLQAQLSLTQINDNLEEIIARIFDYGKEDKRSDDGQIADRRVSRKPFGGL